MLADVQLRSIPRTLGARKMKRSQLAQEIDHHGAEAIRLDPERADGYVIRAKAAMIEGDTFRSSSWASEAVKREPDNPVAHQVLGMSAELHGDTKAAADHYVTSGRLNPRSTRSTELLKRMRKRAPIGIVVTLILIRLVSMPLRNAGGVGQAIGVGVVLAFVVFVFVVWPRLNARRAMSAEARQVLERDRQLRRG